MKVVLTTSMTPYENVVLYRVWFGPKGTCRKHRGTSQQVPQLSIVHPWRTDTCVFWCGFPLYQHWHRGSHLNGSSIQPEIQHPPLWTLLSGSKRASAPPSGEQHLWVPWSWSFSTNQRLSHGESSQRNACNTSDGLFREKQHKRHHPASGLFSVCWGYWHGGMVSSIPEASKLLETLNSRHDTIKFELELLAADGYLPLLTQLWRLTKMDLSPTDCTRKVQASRSPCILSRTIRSQRRSPL